MMLCIDPSSADNIRVLVLGCSTKDDLPDIRLSSRLIMLSKLNNAQTEKVLVIHPSKEQIIAKETRCRYVIVRNCERLL